MNGVFVVHPLVSVVIPAYNRPHTLRIGIDSVLEQTYPNIEIVICDDSTNDGVQEMLGSYLQSYPQIKYYKNEKNLFLKNWHKCFDLASGEYINYLMDDDLFHKEKIAKMIRFYAEFENISLVTSFRQTINESGEFLPPIDATARLYEETRILDGKMLANVALTRCLNVIGEPTTVLFRKMDLTERFGEYRGKQYSLINDLVAWLCLLSKGRAVYIPQALSYFRLHGNQNNKKLGLNAFSEWLDIMNASREDGFLDTDELFKTALHSYRERVKGRELPLDNKSNIHRMESERTRKDQMAILVVAFFNVDLVRRTLLSLVNQFRLTGESQSYDIYILENTSPNSEEMEKMLTHYYPWIRKYIRSDLNNAASIIIDAFDQGLILRDYPFYGITEGDIILDNGAIDECFEMMNKYNLKIGSVGLRLDNLPIQIGVQTGWDWILAGVDGGDCEYQRTGHQFEIIQRDFFFDYLKYARTCRTGMVETIQHYVAASREKWYRTKNKKLLHTGWDLYTPQENEYTRYKKSLSNTVWDYKPGASLTVIFDSKETV